MVQDSTLTLKTNVTRPFDKTRQIASSNTNISTNVKVTGTSREQGVGLSLARLLGFVLLGLLASFLRGLEEKKRALENHSNDTRKVPEEQGSTYHLEIFRVQLLEKLWSEESFTVGFFVKLSKGKMSKTKCVQ